jgi:hypothetical protein
MYRFGLVFFALEMRPYAKMFMPNLMPVLSVIRELMMTGDTQTHRQYGVGANLIYFST